MSIFALAVHGTRGDVEPCAAVGLELRRRGHEVRMAVPPDLVPFVEHAGLSPAVGYGVHSQQQVESDVFQNWWKARNPLTALQRLRDYATDGWDEMGSALTSLSEGSDLILTGTTYQEVAANVGEYQHLPLATLHYFPARPNAVLGEILPVPLPGPVVRAGMVVGEWAYWRLLKQAEDRQRRQLGLPPATTRSMRRIVERGTLEIQAYDEALFPGLAAEWGDTRPFVGSITMELSTETDEDVARWLAEGSPPIYFGFGSTPIDSPDEVYAVIDAVCAELGERALICSSIWSDRPGVDRIRVVKSANYPTVFPNCRATVHHGGAGTTSAGLRAGLPTVILWSVADQPVWANRVERLKVGVAQRFSKLSRESLLAALRRVLEPGYAQRARELSTRMIRPADGVAKAADLLEAAADHASDNGASR
ncbi:glycosyltransferase [Candidatus Mycolicibacterium alkanivorans]|uniref:Glycosyltransferase n=1 Tax=Candidatus Mycolicibacterium alkanivorans TaxID=2954114 RepID=A0ABS9YY75_9MYCO|nr:glycosyltransferase [Candidatus Mycolicibacterium alkanivorans]MCI4676052.1 glycosyltransferase [Candidatus Mycolicibacterium alkanivorans]